MKEFGVSQTVATLGTSLSLLGYAIGPMLWSPLSEVPQMGRKTIYIVTLAVFLLLKLPIVLASNIETVLIFRFLSAFAGSPAQATGGATISDMYLPRDRSYGLGLWELSTWIGPTLGPLVGGFVAQAKGWRWTIWELIWVNSAMLIFIFCFLPETSASNILYRRAKRLRREAGVQSIRAASELESLDLSKKELAYKTLIRPFVLCFQEPICLLLNTYTALITGLLFAWLESLPIVFGGIYGFNLGQIGLAFLGLLLGSVVAYLLFVVWFFAFESKKFDYNGYRAPEERFIPLMAGCIFIPICLFIFGWSAKADIPWIVPIIGSGLFSVGGFSLFVSFSVHGHGNDQFHLTFGQISILNYLPDAYPEYAASVLAGNNFIRCSFGAGCVLFAAPMYHNLGIAWASTLLAILGCVFVPVPFLFYFYGDRIRLASKNALKAPRKPHWRSYCSEASPRVGEEAGNSSTTPRAAVPFTATSSVSYQPQSVAVTYSATSNAPTLNTEAFYEPHTPITSALATPKRAASPVPRTIERERRDMIDTMSGGRVPSIKN